MNTIASGMTSEEAQVAESNYKEAQTLHESAEAVLTSKDLASWKIEEIGRTAVPEATPIDTVIIDCSMDWFMVPLGFVIWFALLWAVWFAFFALKDEAARVEPAPLTA